MLNDFWRMILVWKLMLERTAASIREVVEAAVALTGMRHVPLQDKTRLLTDNGPGYLAQVLEDYLRMPSIRHLCCSPHHPQTNGKLERFHQTIKTRLNVLVYPSPEALQRAIAEFLEYYNQTGYHEGIGNVAPADVYYGRREEIRRRREEQKQRTLEARLRYNLGRSEPSSEGDSGLQSVACP
ncbi:MAG: integrase core domain-containing protein [Acidobacteriota bacterium]|nr:integrase core domain-containing protein [Acidobacteriota bacterium]